MNLSVAGYWEFCFDALGCQFLEKGKGKGGGKEEGERKVEKEEWVEEQGTEKRRNGERAGTSQE